MGHPVESIMETGSICYRMSKSALGVLTRSFYGEHHQRGLRVDCVCPGFVHTAMTAHLVGVPGIKLETPQQGADTIVWLCVEGPSASTSKESHISGWFWRRRQIIPW
jgi:NAD(P)-dependent dehydrogenase (short-subunit alcohol dehydrogenase family)